MLTILIEEKKQEPEQLEVDAMTDDVIRDREEITEQIRALQELKAMAAAYGYDISKPATNARKLSNGCTSRYLAAIKEQNGAAMSLGRVSSFLDIYIERDLQKEH